MFFEVINCSPNNNSKNLQKIRALSNILTSSHERKNIVVADAGAMREVIESSDYGIPQKVAAQEIIDLELELRPLSKRLLISAIIDFAKTSNDCIYDPTINKFIFGYGYFCDSANAQSVNLVAENSADCDFYKAIVRLYSSLHGNVAVNFRPISGSGSQSKPEFDRLVALNAIVLCIVDSDQKHPKGAKGGTAAQFLKKDFLIGRGHLAVMLDGRRELENLVPMSFYRMIAERMQGTKVDVFDEILRLVELNYDFYRYFDFKGGLNLVDALSLDRLHGQFWKTILQSNKVFSKHKCFKVEDEVGCTKCPRIEGFGDKVLTHVLPLFEKSNRSYVEKNTGEPLYSELKKIADLLLGWGCVLNFESSIS